MPLTVTRELSITCRLRREPAQVSHARRQICTTLPSWGLDEHTDLASLIVSELVTNALRYGDGLIEVRLSYMRGDLLIEVHDDGEGRPVRQQAAPDDERGRGLELLDGLIALHGGMRGVIDHDGEPGKTVYVAIALPDSPAGGR